MVVMGSVKGKGWSGQEKNKKEDRRGTQMLVSVWQLRGNQDC